MTLGDSLCDCRARARAKSTSRGSLLRIEPCCVVAYRGCVGCVEGRLSAIKDWFQ